MTKNIALIRFSSREDGNCASIEAQITEHYTTQSVHSYTVDSNNVHPCNNCDYECLQPNKLCPNLSAAYKELMNAVCNAGLIYFIVPNYCGYPCANYFAFNERSVGYFNLDRALMEKYMSIPKRFIVISNTEGQNFENAMQQQQTNDKPDILYLKSSKYSKRSIAGDMLESDAAKTDLAAFLDRHSL